MSWICLSLSEVYAAEIGTIGNYSNKVAALQAFGNVLKQVFLFWALVILLWLFISIKLFCNLWTDLICLTICKRWFLENWLVNKLFGTISKYISIVQWSLSRVPAARAVLLLIWFRNKVKVVSRFLKWFDKSFLILFI